MKAINTRFLTLRHALYLGVLLVSNTHAMTLDEALSASLRHESQLEVKPFKCEPVHRLCLNRPSNVMDSKSI